MLPSANNRRDSRLPIWGGAIAFFVGGAFVATLLATDGWRGFRPSDAWRSLLFVAVIAAGLSGVLSLFFRAPLKRRIVAGFIVIAAAAFFRSPIDNQIVWQFVAAAGTLLLWLSLEPLTIRRPGAFMPMGVAISLAASCVLMMEHLHFASLALPMAGLAAAMLIIIVVAWFRPAIPLGSALLAAIIINSASLLTGWLYARQYTGVPWFSVVGVGFSPLGLWAARFPPAAERPRFATFLGIAVTIAISGLSLLAA